MDEQQTKIVTDQSHFTHATISLIPPQLHPKLLGGEFTQEHFTLHRIFSAQLSSTSVRLTNQLSSGDVGLVNILMQQRSRKHTIMTARINFDSKFTQMHLTAGAQLGPPWELVYTLPPGLRQKQEKRHKSGNRGLFMAKRWERKLRKNERKCFPCC